MRTDFARSRDHLAGGLADAGFAVLPAEGTHFLSIDLAASGIPLDDVTFCERAAREAGVAASPVSALYADTARKSVVKGRSVSVGVDLGGRRSIQNKTRKI